MKARVFPIRLKVMLKLKRILKRNWTAKWMVSSIKQSAFIHVNSIGRRNLVFPSGIKVIYSFTASKAILFNARYIFVHIETKIVEWVYVQ